MKIYVLLGLFICTFSLCAQTQKSNYTLKGRVLDSLSSHPIPFANISFKNQNKGTSADTDGYFELQSEADNFILEISHIGYEKKLIEIYNISSEILEIKLVLKSELIP